MKKILRYIKNAKYMHIVSIEIRSINISYNANKTPILLLLRVDI